MANLIFTDFKHQLALGVHNFGTDTHSAALFTSAYTPTATDTTYNTTNEVAAGGGYTQGGQSIGAATVTENGTTVEIDAPDVTWASSTITARWAQIRKTTGANLVAAWDFVSDESSSNGNFTLQFAAAGFITL